MSKKLFLTSSGIITNSLKEEFFKFLGRSPKGLRLCLITTAAYPGIKHEWLDPVVDQLEDYGFEIELMDLEYETKKTLKDKLPNFDVIYVNGGNTFKLLKYSRESGFNDLIADILEQGKVYVGVSAGSILVGPTIEMASWKDLVPDENVVGLKDLKGINLVNLAVFPHFEQENINPLDKATKKVAYPIVAITEEQAIVVKNEEWKVVGVGEELIYNQ